MALERRELAIAAWGSVAFAAVLASYTALRPVRDALVVDGDPDRIPWLFSATFVAVAAVAPVWGAALARHAPRRLVPIAFQVFAACELGFVALVRADVAPVAVGRVFYVWAAVLGLFVVSVLWSLFADLLGPAAASRLYGPITAGGTVGAIAGPALTQLLVGTIGVAGVLAMSAVLLELATLAVGQVRRAAGEHAREAMPARGGAFSGLAHVARSPYLAAIVGYVLCTACAATFVYLEQVHLLRVALPDRIARTQFLSSVDVWTNVCVLAVQALAAAPLLRRFGPGAVLCVLPVAQLAGISWLAAAPSLGALAVIAVVTRSATHGLTRPARELLFTVLARDDKYAAKNVIDTTAYRAGDFGASWLVLAGASGAVMVVAAIPLVVAWLSLAIALGMGFRRRLKEAP
ncbi:MAG TPA: MFS transporter [Kofleriaceae bacterium]|nr:MFS transporter [Kofleriaceae bacterium]